MMGSLKVEIRVLGRGTINMTETEGNQFGIQEVYLAGRRPSGPK